MLLKNTEHLLKVDLLKVLRNAIDTWENFIKIICWSITFYAFYWTKANVFLFSNLQKFPWRKKCKVFVLYFTTFLLLVANKNRVVINHVCGCDEGVWYSDTALKNSWKKYYSVVFIKSFTYQFKNKFFIGHFSINSPTVSKKFHHCKVFFKFDKRIPNTTFSVPHFFLLWPDNMTHEQNSVYLRINSKYGKYKSKLRKILGNFQKCLDHLCLHLS